MKDTTLSGNLPKQNIAANFLVLKRNTSIEVISFLLVLLFAYAAISKVLEFQTFRLQLSKSPFISQYAGIIYWALPVVELLVAFLLAIRPLRLIGLFASLFLMTMFSSYIYLMLHYSYYLPCSCGGILSTLDWTSHFWFNLSFVGISTVGIFIENKIRNRQ
jgi:hypothetical protein